MMMCMKSPFPAIKGMLGLYKGLPQPVYVLFFATIINGVGIFVYPFLVLYLTQHMGYSNARAGMFMSVASLAYLPGSFIGGKLADKIGRKKVMLIGQSLASLMFLICGLMGTSSLVPVFILLNLLFDGATDPARNALNIDVTTQENRQASFSLNYLGHNLGFSIGPVVAGFLFYRAPQWLFFGNGLLGLVSVLFVMWKVPESKPDAKAIEASYHDDSTERSHRGGLIKALLSRPRLLILAVCATFFSFTYSQSLFALPLYTTALYGEQGATLYGSMMSLNAIVVVLFNAPVVLFFRRWHPLKNIAIAGVLYAVGFACMGLVRAPVWFYVLTFIYTLGEIIGRHEHQFLHSQQHTHEPSRAFQRDHAGDHGLWKRYRPTHRRHRQHPLRTLCPVDYRWHHRHGGSRQRLHSLPHRQQSQEDGMSGVQFNGDVSLVDRKPSVFWLFAESSGYPYMMVALGSASSPQTK